MSGDTSLAFNFVRGRDTASPAMRKVGDEATRMGARVRASSVVSVAATTAMVAGWASLAAQSLAVVSAVSPMVNVVALLPSAGVAAAGGIGALAIASGGLAASLKQTAGGGAAAASSIAAAERRIAVAQREGREAQESLNDARKTAAERLDDMTRSLARAMLDEEEAVDAVADAQRRLRDARRSGDRNERDDADRAYRSSLLTLDEVRERLEDLKTEQTEASAVGVEGSDEVQQALQRQADAARELKDATDAMNAAKSGGGGTDAAAVAYARLSGAGRDLVDVIRALRPEWRAVQQTIQEATFAGVAGDVKALSGVYLPIMRTQLAAIGAGWNVAMRGSAQLAATNDFARDVNLSLGHMALMWLAVGRAWAPFLSGFRHIMAVGSTFLPGFGQGVLNVAQAFDRWADAARSSGRMQTWISQGIAALVQLWAVAKNVGSAIMGIVRAGGDGGAALAWLVTGTAAMAAWINSAEGQERLGQIFAFLRDILTQLAPALVGVGSAVDPLTGSVGVLSATLGFLSGHLDWIAANIPLIVGLFLAYKASQLAANAAAVVSLPIQAARVVSELVLASAIRNSTLAQKQGLVAMAAAKVAGLAAATWQGIVTVAQWAWNASLWGFPLVWIIAAIIAVIAVIVLIATKTTWFQDLWNWAWKGIVGAFEWVKAAFWASLLWIHEKITWVVELLLGIRQRVISAAAGMWDGLVSSFKSAINALIRLWNNFSLTIGGGSVLGMDIPSLTLSTPDIPYLAKGGDITESGLAVVGDAGPEVVHLPTGASVHPLSTTSGRQEVVVRIELKGSEEMKRFIRKIVQSNGGSASAAFDF